MKTAKRVLVVLAVIALLVGALAVSAFAATGDYTYNYTFSNFTAGTQYAVDEEHVLDENITVWTTQAHFTTQLRLYSSTEHDGNAIFYANGKAFQGIGFNAGNKVDTVNVYGANAKEGPWTLIEGVSVTSTSYKDYQVAADLSAASYTYVKLDVAGSQQVRIASIGFELGEAGDVEEKDPSDKVAAEKDNVKLETEITKAGLVNVMTAGSTYTDVLITWESNSDLAVVDNDAGTITYTLPEAGAEDVLVTLTATITCGEAFDTKEFPVTIVAPPDLSGPVPEGTIEWVASTQGYSNGQSIKDVEISLSDYVSMMATGGSTAPAYYNTGTAIRIYGEGTLTITPVEGCSITSVVITTASGSYAIASGVGLTNCSASGLSTATVTLTPDNASEAVAISRPSGSGHYRIQKIVVNYGPDVVADADATNKDKVDTVLSTLSTKTEITAAEVIKLTTVGNPYEDVTISWASNNALAVVNGGQVAYTLPEAGAEDVVVTLTATVSCGEVSVTKEFPVTLVAPMSEAEIVDAAFALASGATLPGGEYTLTGVVSSIEAYNSNYSDVNLNITVYGTNGTAKTLYCYGLKGTGNDLVQVGDEITVTGNIKNYNDTVEFDKPDLVKYPNNIKVDGVSLNIADNIDVYYYVTAPGFKSATASFVFDGKTTTATGTKLADGRIQFVFEGINPTQLGDAINATFNIKYSFNTYTTKNDGMSVKKYYEMAQAYEGTKNDTALMTLLSDLLVYGAAAQTYVGDTDALVTEGLTLTPSTNAIPESVFSAEGDAYKSIALELGSDITVSLKVALKEGDVVNVYHNDRCTSFAEADLIADADGYYTVEFANVYASDYASTITVELNGKILTYSVNSYIAEKANDENANLAALVAALNNYGASAAAYKNA